MCKYYVSWEPINYTENAFENIRNINIAIIFI